MTTLQIKKAEALRGSSSQGLLLRKRQGENLNPGSWALETMLYHNAASKSDARVCTSVVTHTNTCVPTRSGQPQPGWAWSFLSVSFT